MQQGKRKMGSTRQTCCMNTYWLNTQLIILLHIENVWWAPHCQGLSELPFENQNNLIIASA